MNSKHVVNEQTEARLQEQLSSHWKERRSSGRMTAISLAEKGILTGPMIDNAAHFWDGSDECSDYFDENPLDMRTLYSILHDRNLDRVFTKDIHRQFRQWIDRYLTGVPYSDRAFIAGFLTCCREMRESLWG